MSEIEGITEEEKRVRAAVLGFARRDKEIAELKAALSASLSKEKELREALEWYAEKENYYATGYGTPALKDCGRRARTAMER